MTCRNVRFWHLASFAATHHFIRYWTKADKGGVWPAMVLENRAVCYRLRRSISPSGQCRLNGRTT
jgi:hypothetical protein